MAEQTPRVLTGRYEIGDLIGRGGMAEVHIGRDTRLGRTVAIKILRPDLAIDTTFQSRFRREAQAAASLNHPAIVAVYDTGEDVSVDATGNDVHLPFIIMEYVEGHTVRELVQEGTALPIDEALDTTIGVLSALQYAHHMGIVHRDIKPANIMLTSTGQIKVMDFGIARALTDSATTMTQTQAVIGTAQYLSPEQARGETVDSRSDLYSTGCVLYELLTGRPPFVGDTAVSVAYQHVREMPAPPSAYAPDIPPALDAITLKALDKDRDRRYQTAQEFRADLENFKRGDTVSATAAAPTSVLAPVAAGGSPTWPAVQGASGQTSSTGVLPLVDEDERKHGKAFGWILGLVSVGVVGLIVIALGLVLGWFGGSAAPNPQATTSQTPSVTATTPSPTATTPSASPTPSVSASTAPANITVPSTSAIGCGTSDVITQNLVNLGFSRSRITLQSTSSESVPPTCVISTSLPAGASVAPSTPITVTISTGPAPVVSETPSSSSSSGAGQ